MCTLLNTNIMNKCAGSIMMDLTPYCPHRSFFDPLSHLSDWNLYPFKRARAGARSENAKVV
jgi:hypothetical protein